MKYKLSIIFAILLVGCGSNDHQKKAMISTLEECPIGGTLSATTTLSHWNSEISVTCTWEKKAND
mgnify:CR=1 FL=1